MASNPPDSTIPAHQRSRSASRTRIPSRPTTPLRPSSRNSLRNSQQASTAAAYNPLDALEAQFAEFSDGMADLEANFMHLQLMHESLSRFSESFAGFLYGMNMNAFCVDFLEAPVQESFKRSYMLRPQMDSRDGMMGGGAKSDGDGDATFMTNDTSFVEHPPQTSKASSKYSTPAPSRTRGTAGAGRARGIPRGSGLPRGTAGRGRGRGGGVLR
ncbi:hypothetical protein BLS_002690 [Venturia inaequalis]|uniref:DASH complex subunit DAM1 n=1 Tax=Venturia inaequalis TaxID=5025 RepID=A0A8H3U1I6_VENIN|nr:hypothetical protein BLS_002690 [Venturia inaequalis]KAE9976939.1 hypothetical protein EG328_002332 [Venturia inaequalis]RDI83973.1 hypothetical protein Vi05172_g6080 [Venturia inaequalis]